MCVTTWDEIDEALDRIVIKIDRDMEKPVDGCWNWSGAKDRGGYGIFHLSPGVNKKAHHLTYIHEIGEIEPGMTIDHLCYNTSCVRPEHLEQVTQAENSRRAAERRRSMLQQEAA